MIIARVPSFSEHDRTYAVRRELYLGEVVLTCECPAFGLTGRGVKPCKHIALVNWAEDAIAVCRKLHPENRDGLCRACLIGLMASIVRKVSAAYDKKPIAPHEGGPIKTSLKRGSLVRYRRKGAWTYAEIIQEPRQPKALRPIPIPEHGTQVYECRWSRDWLLLIKVTTVRLSKRSVDANRDSRPNSQ